MARSLMKRRQEAERGRIAVYDATLKHHARAPRLAPDFDRALAEATTGLRGLTKRDPADFRPRLKSRDPGKLRLAAARHLYGLYPVSGALEAIWLDEAGLAAAEIALRKSWYVIAAGGGSLFKQGAGEWLTRKEVHHLVTAPGGLSFDQAFWRAIALTYTMDHGAALRIAGSKIATSPRGELGFWRQAVQFFSANPVSRERMDDLVDFLGERRRRGGFSFEGRTIGSLERLMREWHDDLAAVRRIEAARQREAIRENGGGFVRVAEHWRGATLADWSWKPSDKEARKLRGEYAIVQLRTAAELVEETRAMRHCVSAYASKCVAGQASIWSLRLASPRHIDRLLTIELDRQNRAVQVRGFANRLPRPDEVQVLGRWAKARGIEIV